MSLSHSDYRFIKTIPVRNNSHLSAYLYHKDNKKYTLKPFPTIKNTQDAKRVLREIRILNKLQHDNIIDIQRVLYNNSESNTTIGKVSVLTKYMESN